MFKRIKAVVTRSVSTNRPEEAVGPDARFDRQYSKQIRRKHVSIAALCFMSGSALPMASALLMTGSPEIAFAAAFACVTLLSIALPDISKLTTCQWVDRRRALDTQEECIDLQCELAQLREKYSDLHFNYCVLSAVIERTADDADQVSAEIIQLNSTRRDH